MSFDKGEWKPNKKQAAFLSIPWTIKEAFYGGGAGSGKSDVLLVYGIIHRLHENPLFKQVFMRRTTQDIKKEIVGRTWQLYPKFGAKYNATDMIWTFPRPDQFGSGMQPRGAQIFLAHCEHEKDVHNFDSMEISLYTPDELTNLTEFIYIYVGFQRGRAPAGSGLHAVIRGAGMPGGIGHTFVKKRFVDPDKSGGKIIIGKGGNKRIYIHATLEDNKEHVDSSYGQSLEGLTSEAEKKAKKFGDWSAYQGQVFDEFRDKKYPDEPENALHVIPAFNIPEWWPRMVIGDWGFAAMTYIGFYAISPNGRLYLYRELAYLKTKISVWAHELNEFIQDENIKIIKFCKSAGQDRGSDHTIQQQIETELGRPIELTNNSSGSRVATKLLVHEYMRWKPKPTIPLDTQLIYDESYALWLYRNKGDIEYKNYLKLFDPPEVESNIPRLQIFCCDAEQHEGHLNCCPLMIDAIKACNYDKPKNDLPAEDVAEWNGDDPYDDLRYAVDSAEQYFKTASDEYERLQKRQVIIDTLEKNKDWTAFYRNLNHLESTKQTYQVVKRFHSGARIGRGFR